MNKINREWFLRIKKILNENLIEREEAVELLLLALLAGENAFLIGEPGIAKSLLISRFEHLLKDESGENEENKKNEEKGGAFFKILMHPFSVPEMINGTLILDNLGKGIYEYNTKGYLPSVKLAFLDEIFKANPILLNTLLTAINEKTFNNGVEIKKIPLQSLFGASNELPNFNDDNENVNALWDRFLVRIKINSISQSKFAEFLSSNEVTSKVKIKEEDKLSYQDFKDIKEKLEKIEVDDNVLDVFLNLRIKLNEKIDIKEKKETINQNEIWQCSDRRFKKILKFLKVLALINEKENVDLMDCFMISKLLGDGVNYKEELENMVYDTIKNYAFNFTDDTSEIETKIKEYQGKINGNMKEYQSDIEAKTKEYQNELEKETIKKLITFVKNGIVFYKIEGIKVTSNNIITGIAKDIYDNYKNYKDWSYSDFYNGFNGTIEGYRFIFNNQKQISFDFYLNEQYQTIRIKMKKATSQLDREKFLRMDLGELKEYRKIFTNLETTKKEILKDIESKKLEIRERKVKESKKYEDNIFKDDKKINTLSVNIDQALSNLSKFGNKIEELGNIYSGTYKKVKEEIEEEKKKMEKRLQELKDEE